MGEIEEEYLRNHPEEIDDYITVLFDEYAESGDTATLLSSLLVVSCVKGNCDRKKGDLNMPVVKGIKKSNCLYRFC